MAWDGSTLDAVVKALSASHSQPGSIRKACEIMEDYMLSNKDNLRAFFNHCFPILLKRIFGYDDQEVSWLNIISKSSRQEDAEALVRLLSPEGVLFQAMHSSDADRLIQFRFPPERLPAHTQELLRTLGGRGELERWPQYHGRVEVDPAGRCCVNLNLFEYFLFWNAFYVLRGSRVSDLSADLAGGRTQRPGQQLVAGLRSYGAQLLSSGGGGGSSSGSSGLQVGGGSVMRHPYFKLLRMYLEHYLPRKAGPSKGRGGGAGGGGLPGGAWGGAGGGAGGVGGGGLLPQYLVTPGSVYVRHADVLWAVLLEFWLTDAAEPLPPDPPATSRAGSPGQMGYSSAGAAGLVGFGAGMAGAAGSSPGGLTAAGGQAGAAGLVALGFSTTPAAAADLMATGMPGAPAAAAMAGMASPPAPLRAVISTPPAEELVVAVTHLARYVYVREPQRPEAVCEPAQEGSTSWLPAPSVQTYPPPAGRLALGLSSSFMAGAPATPAVQALGRKLYRFMRRGMAAWQPGSSASMTPLVRCLLVVLAPWRAMTWEETRSLHSFRATSVGREILAHQMAAATATLNRWGSGLQQHLPGHHAAAGSGQGGQQGGQQYQTVGSYTPAWRSHVLLHLPFYGVLVPQLLELCAARMPARADSALRDAYAVLRELSFDEALVDLLEQAEAAANRYLSGSQRSEDGPAWGELLPWWAEQLKDWEGAAAAGQPTTPAVIPVQRFRLFGVAEGSGAWWVRGMLRAADSHGISAKFRDRIAEVAAKVLPLEDLPADEGRLPPPGPTADTAHFPKPGDWRRLAYKGDPLLRPIASNEVAPLARWLVGASTAVNTFLGLDGVPHPQQEPAETLLQEWLVVARKRGWRLNLRPLAEVQLLLWLGLLALLAWGVSIILATSGAEEVGLGGVSGSQRQYGGGSLHNQHQRPPQPHHEQQQWGQAGGVWQGNDL